MGVLVEYLGGNFGALRASFGGFWVHKAALGPNSGIQGPKMVKFSGPRGTKNDHFPVKIHKNVDFVKKSKSCSRAGGSFISEP